MGYGICHLNIIPIRAEAAHRSEQVSQLLFGETFTVLESTNGWLRIACSHDGYEGWIQESQQLPLPIQDYTELARNRPWLSCAPVQTAETAAINSPIVIGSTLPFYRDGKGRIGKHDFNFSGSARQPDPLTATPKMVVENAHFYLNAPYLWGGRSPFGIDCSGFTQMTYRLCGVSLKRDAWMQAEQGETIHLLDETRPGDLAFFDNEEGRITHVGILTEKNRILHASGQVRLDNIDHHGIFNTTTRRYTHTLRLMKRMI